MAKSKEEEFYYDAANEQVVIQAAILSKQRRKALVHQLSSDEFLVPRHSLIWKALRAVEDQGLDYSNEIMTRMMRDEGGDDAALEYLAQLEEDLPDRVDNLEWHVGTLQWDATRARALKTSIPELIKAVKDPKATPNDVHASTRAVSRALEGGGRRHIHRPEVLYRNYRAELAARRAKRNVYPLGFDVFDHKLTEGFMPGRTTVVAGVPGSGKSTVMAAWTIFLAQLGRRPLYCCWEMEPESMIDVMCSFMTGVTLRQIVQGELSDKDAKRVDKASKWILSKIRFMGLPFFDELRRGDKKKPSNDRNLDILEGYIAESGCDVAVYDVWERMLFWLDPSDVSRALIRMQDLHKEYAVQGVIVQHLRLKDVEARSDKRPTRESIKGTGTYTEVADQIYGIHRDAQFKKVEDNTVETINMKQRKGESNWSIRWAWDGARCYVGDPEEVPYDPGLESAVEVGDIGGIKTGGKGKGGDNKGKRSSRVGRRDQ